MKLYSWPLEDEECAVQILYVNIAQCLEWTSSHIESGWEEQRNRKVETRASLESS